MFAEIYKRFREAYNDSFYDGVRGKKATLDMINLASAVWRLYQVDLVTEVELTRIRNYYFHIGNCACKYDLEMLWVGEVL